MQIYWNVKILSHMKFQIKKSNSSELLSFEPETTQLFFKWSTLILTKIDQGKICFLSYFHYNVFL